MVADLLRRLIWALSWWIPRVQLWEWHDVSWVPAVLKDCHRELLYFLYETGPLPAMLAPGFAEVLEVTGATRIVDMCSGAGGVLPLVMRHLPACKRLTLTDLYPNVAAYERIVKEEKSGIDFVSTPVDATKCKIGSDGEALRTIFGAFHHLPPELGTAVLRNAVEAGSPIAIVEGTQRDVVDLTVVPTVVPLVQLLTSPFIRPFRLSRLLFTYVIPILPLINVWDCAISVLRTSTDAELAAMAKAADPAGKFQWHTGSKRVNMASLTYCVGYPKKAAALRGLFADAS